MGSWLFSTTFPWWPLVVVAMIWLWMDKRLIPIRFRLSGFFIASVLTVFPGFYFRQHYFLLVLPAAALLIGCSVSSLRRLGEKKWPHSLWRGWPLFGWSFFLAATIFVNFEIWFKVPLPETVRLVYGSDTLLEGQSAGKLIRAHSSPSDKVAIQGSEPEIYFIARRHSATGYIYVYPLMETQPFARQMQDEMIREIETNAPAFIVYAHNFASWMKNPDSDPHIFNWWDDYQTNYTLVGIVDSAAPAREIWGESAVAAYGNQVRGFGFAIYQRKTMR